VKSIEYIQQDNEFNYLRDLIVSMEDGKCLGILLQGPPGTGKTLLAISLAKSFNAPYYIVDGSPDLDRRDLEGNWEILNGDTKFNYGPLTKGIEDANKDGISFIIINEINAIRESEQISLNSLLSENHVNLISKGFERYELNKKSKLIVIGTLNKGVIGVNKLQEAFEDRFLVTPEITFPIKPKEIEIATKISGCKRNLAEIVVDAARQIRKQAIKDFSITKIFSTRLVVNFCLVVSKMSPSYIKCNIENIIINKLGETQEERKSIALLLDGKMFESKIRNMLRPEPTVPNHSTQLITATELEIINKARNKVKDYSHLLGSGKFIKSNGVLMWKFFEWFWYNNKKIIQQYFHLTEKLNYHKIYKRETGKKHRYNEEITLKYIKWLYRNKNKDLMFFMTQIYPILD